MQLENAVRFLVASERGMLWYADVRSMQLRYFDPARACSWSSALIRGKLEGAFDIRLSPR